MKKKKGFTLVELLAVIVILAVILVIAVPRISEVINNSKKASFEATTKTIISQAEKKYMENEVLGKSGSLKCSDVAKINSSDYEECKVTFDTNGNASVSITGSGKFAGLVINNATKNSATVLTETNSKWFTYEDTEGGIKITGYEVGYDADITIKDKSKCVNYLNSLADSGYYMDSDTIESTCNKPIFIYNLILDSTIASSDYENAGIEVKWLENTKDGGGRNVVIPKYIDNKKVVAIGDYSLMSRYLTSVVIPKSVTSIGFSSFASNKLTSIIIPEGVTFISNNAFQSNPLTSIVIPNSVTSIGERAFFGEKLSKVVNKTGKSFDWGLIVNGESNEDYTFETGTLTSFSLININVVSE